MEERATTSTTEVNTFELVSKHNILYKVENFKAGQISEHINQWQKLTSDRRILNIVKGDSIDFESSPPVKHFSKNAKFSMEEDKFIKSEITKLLNKRVIVETHHETNEYVSPIFTVRKSDGGIRLILNLKSLNKSVAYHHFKMASIKSVLFMISKDCYMASIDLKDAYYSVPIKEEFQKYLKFSYDDTLYKFTCFPNGLAPCPRKFTKLTKVPMSQLRLSGCPIEGYIDDFITNATSKEACNSNIDKIITMFDSLGFVVNPEKSKLESAQEIVFLGFVINSKIMKVSLTPQRTKQLNQLVSQLLTISNPSIRFLAKVIGTIISCLQAAKFGLLHYRNLERLKVDALKKSGGDFNAHCFIDKKGREELTWWKSNSYNLKNWIHPPPIMKELHTDASTLAWGSVFENYRTGGAWSFKEKILHINCLEILAILYGVRSFLKDLKNYHVRILSDNTAAVGIINKMGSSKSLFADNVSKAIWNLCREYNIWITATHIPGTQNKEADECSRKNYKDSEWKLNPDLFSKYCKLLSYVPTLDCFASRLNSQIATYVAYRPDPYATHIDAFSINWRSYCCYLFPPFSLVPKVLQKIKTNNCRVMIVVPDWPTQSWYNTFMILAEKYFVISPHPRNLILPQDVKAVHPLAKKMNLLVGVLSKRST